VRRALRERFRDRFGELDAVVDERHLRDFFVVGIDDGRRAKRANGRDLAAVRTLSVYGDKCKWR
jgi:hypothetical protein